MQRYALRIAFIVLFVVGCSKSMFGGTHAKEGIDAITAKIGADANIKRVTVFDNKVLVNAEDPKHPGQLVQYWSANGKVGGPTPIITAGGSIAKVVFKTSAIDFTKVPTIADAVKKKSGGKEVRQLDVSYDVNHPELPLAWLVQTMNDKWWFVSLDGTGITSTDDDDRYGNRVLQLRLREGSE